MPEDLTLRPDLAPTVARARALAELGTSDATRRAYGSAWRSFRRWTAARELPTLPTVPDVVALYLADQAERLKPSTLGLHLAAIASAHRAASAEDPTKAEAVRVVMRGLRRAQGVAPDRKAPLRVRELWAILGAMDDGLKAQRDRALLLLGFALGARRSELVALDVGDLVEVPEGIEVTIRRAKTDQEAAGRRAGVPYASRPELCPVRAVRAWLAVSEITDGALFRQINRWGTLGGRLSGRAVARVVQDRAALAGFDPAGFGGHSLRSGLATEAAAAGASERSIMGQTGHRSLRVLRGYIRAGSLFRDNAAAAALEKRDG